MKKKVGVFLPVFVAVFLIAFFIAQVILMDSDKQAPEVQDDSVEYVVPSYDTVVDGNSRFAFDLYDFVRKREEGNIFFSPFSVSNVLAMTYEGARGKTAEEIRSVSHLPFDNSIRRSGFSRLYGEVFGMNSGYELRTANSLWADRTHPIMGDFINTVRDVYRGDAQTADFKNNSSGAIDVINGWMAHMTGGKIPSIVGKDSVNNLTRLVLVNAVYFKGAWLEAFDKSQTGYEEFRAYGDQPVQTPMMRRTGRYPYVEEETFVALEIPYAGENVSMIILLPKDGSVESLEPLLIQENLEVWRDNLRETEVLVVVPKFTLQQSYQLSDVLRDMGMVSAFDVQRADFSGISGELDLFISGVNHEALIEVNEEGSEVAAATSAGFGTTSVGTTPKLFRVDHPFIFLIQDKVSGSILFFGRVVNPQG